MPPTTAPVSPHCMTRYAGDSRMTRIQDPHHRPGEGSHKRPPFFACVPVTPTTKQSGFIPCFEMRLMGEPWKFGRQRTRRLLGYRASAACIITAPGKKLLGTRGI